MKYLALTVLLLMALPIVVADVGPSPSYSFELGNADQYSDYLFFYAGVIFDDELMPITEETYVYKLDTAITVYAVPKSVAPDVETATSMVFSEVVAQSIVSHPVDLSSGNTVFEIEDFDTATKTMNLRVVSNQPDTTYYLTDLVFIVLFLLLPIIVIVALVVIVVVLVKSSKKQPAKKK